MRSAGYRASVHGGLRLRQSFWRSPPRVFIPAMAVATVFGVIDAAIAAGFDGWIPEWLYLLPGSRIGLGWAVPVLVVVVIAAITDRARAQPAGQPG